MEDVIWIENWYNFVISDKMVRANYIHFFERRKRMVGSLSPVAERTSSASPPPRKQRYKSSSPDDPPPPKRRPRKRESSPSERRHSRKSRRREHSSKRDRRRSRSPRPKRSGSSTGSSRSRSPAYGGEEDGARLHVADLGMGISKSDLKHVYEKFGPIQEIWVAKSPPCFAFIVFCLKDDAEDALKSTDGMTLCGSRVRVSFARPRTRGRGSRGFDPNMRCYQCGDKGHFSRDCPDTRYGYKRPPSRSPSRRGDMEGGPPPSGRRSRRY